MKITHAAALALVGWYLMAPPLQDWVLMSQLNAGSYNSGLKLGPLSQWENEGPYDSADRCFAALVAMRQKADPDPHSVAKTQLQYEARFAQCIASDDPRLKP